MLDLETAPITAFVWGLWDQRIGLNQIIDSGRVLCWAAKWYGSNEMMFRSSQKPEEQAAMIKEIWTLLNEADAVVHFNGNKFDMPILNKEFLLQGLTPPAPAKSIDLLKVCRSRFRFPSNRLDYVADQLGLGQKHKTTFELWIDCMNNKPAAWKKMQRYNKQDVRLLEKLYDRLKPWIKGHPNHSLYSQTGLCCPNCASTRFQRRGQAITQASVYARYQCSATGCGKWFQSGPSQAPKLTDKATGL